MKIRTKHMILTASLALLLSACGLGTGGNTPSAGAGVVAINHEAHALLPKAIRDAGRLVVATDPSYPPCDFVDSATGGIVGINHDLLSQIGAQLGIKIEQKAIQFSGLIPGVQGGQYDAAMECISDTPVREQQVLFIDSNYSANGMVTLKANPAGISEDPLTACGAKFGGQTGTDEFIDANRLSDNCKASGKPGLDITQFPAAADVLTALRSGRVEAMLTSLNTAAYQASKSNGELSVWPNSMASQIYQGIVVSRDAPDLAKALLAALKASIADGSYMKVLQTWDVKDLALMEPGINLATTRPLKEPGLCGTCGK